MKLRWTRLGRSFGDTMPEFRALASRSMPAFVTRRRIEAPRNVAVFMFHAVSEEPFQRQLEFLSSNGYVTLDAAELVETLGSGHHDLRRVALTFDDGTWTFWTYAFPLLKRHRARAVLFVAPGLMPDDPALYSNLDDVRAGTADRAALRRRAHSQPLCTWRELQVMHESGLVDIQSHSLTHSLVPVSPRVVDFLHPGFDTDSFDNVRIPLCASDDSARPERSLRLGAPVFESAPRLTDRPRFVEDEAFVDALLDHVSSHGGPTFFEQPTWRRQLRSLVEEWPEAKRGRFEEPEEKDAMILAELAESKRLLEERLPGKTVEHVCYPWSAGSRLADRLAADIGYRAVHYGAALPSRDDRRSDLIYIRRVSKEYLHRLPGNGRVSLWSIWADRLRRLRAPP